MTKKKQEAPSVLDVPNYHLDWKGYRWTDTGKYLVTPEGDRITPQRLKGLIWRDYHEARLAGFASRRAAEENRSKRQQVKVVVVNLGDFRDKHFGRAAG